MPTGESHAVGDARRDPKLRRRVAFFHFLKGRIQLELLRVYEAMEAMPPTRVKDLICMMSEAAVIVGLAALDKIEGVEQQRLFKAGKSPKRREKVRDNRIARQDGRWLEPLRATVAANRLLSDHEVARKIVEERRAALVREFKTVYRYVRERRPDLL